MKLLFLLDSTAFNDYYLYVKALCEALAGDGYEPKIAFLTDGTPADHTYQLVKPFVVGNKTKLCFRSRDPEYAERLAGHIERGNYDFVIVSQAVFTGTDIHPVCVKDVFEQISKPPRLVFVGSKCCQSVEQSCKELESLNPIWCAVSELVAKKFMPNFDVQVIYGPAVLTEGSGVDIRAEFGVKKDAKLLGFMGDVDGVNWEPVIEAARRMQCLLLIAGTGDKVAMLSEVGRFVKVVPGIPQSERADWYKAFDCFIYPVRASGFPMLPLEAALCRCPVAMTPVSDTYQLLQGKFGFFDWQPERVIQAVQEACAADLDKNKSEVREQFSLDRFLSGWHLLLS